MHDGMRMMRPCKIQALRTWLPHQIPSGINSANRDNPIIFCGFIFLNFELADNESILWSVNFFNGPKSAFGGSLSYFCPTFVPSLSYLKERRKMRNRVMPNLYINLIIMWSEPQKSPMRRRDKTFEQFSEVANIHFVVDEYNN